MITKLLDWISARLDRFRPTRPYQRPLTRRERQERLFREMYSLRATEWAEFFARQDAADYSWDVLDSLGMLTGTETDEQRAWEMGSRLRQLKVSSVTRVQR